MIARRSSKKTGLLKSSKKKESALARVSREYDERKAAEAARKKQKESDDKREYERRKKIIIPYLNNLENHIDEKNLNDFWAFPDNAVFKKIKCDSIQEMQEKLDKKPNLYAGRKICFITLHFEQNKPDSSWHRKEGTWFGVNIDGFNIDKNGKLIKGGRQKFGGHFVWKTKDFATTKFSFKLVERIMKLMAADDRFRFASMLGFDIDFVIRELKKIKVDISDLFQPLSRI